jgi:hypothetical protein
MVLFPSIEPAIIASKPEHEGLPFMQEENREAELLKMGRMAERHLQPRALAEIEKRKKRHEEKHSPLEYAITSIGVFGTLIGFLLFLGYLSQFITTGDWWHHLALVAVAIVVAGTLLKAYRDDIVDGFFR